jgi:hypothetical protein
MRPLVWYSHAEPLKHAIGVFAPGDGDRRRGYGILKDQIPSNDPCDQFAHRGVRISVGAPRERDHGGKLRITEPCKRAAQAGDDEREDDRWTRPVRDRRGGAHKKAGADDSADAESDEIDRPERTLQTVLADFLGLFHELIERLSCEYMCHAFAFLFGLPAFALRVFSVSLGALVA